MKKIFKFFIATVVLAIRTTLVAPFAIIGLVLVLAQSVVAYLAVPFNILSVWLMFLKEGKYSHWGDRAKHEFSKTHNQVVSMFSVKK